MEPVFLNNEDIGKLTISYLNQIIKELLIKCSKIKLIAVLIK